MENKEAKKIYIYSADIGPVTFISVLFMVQCYLFFTQTTNLFLISVCLLPFLTFCVPYSHHHAHLPMSNSKWLNAYVNRILSLQVWTNKYAWKLHHNLGHHKNYMHQHPLKEGEHLDESNWSRPDGSKMSRMGYTFYLAKSALGRIKSKSEKYSEVYQKYMMYRAQNFILYLVLLLINPMGTLFIFILPALAMSLYTFWITYPHHSGLRSSDPYKSSRSITCPIYNFWNTNLGFHAAHHINPYLHWSLLPSLHKEIESKIPEHLVSKSIFERDRKTTLDSY